MRQKKTWVLNSKSGEIHELIDSKETNANCQISEIDPEHSIVTNKKCSIQDILSDPQSGFDACAYCKPLGFESKK